jgi:DNA repair protein RadC
LGCLERSEDYSYISGKRLCLWSDIVKSARRLAPCYNSPDMAESLPKNNSKEGHRQRLRDKFLKSGISGFHDYEIVELLLTLGTPRKDCKEPAKKAIKHFKGLRGVLEASTEELQQVKGIGPNNSFGIKLVRELANESLKYKAQEMPVCGSAQAVYDYLNRSMRDLKIEVFKVLYLDSQNHLLAVEDLFTGTVNASPVFAREVIKGAIKHHATALIFAHNHPSGNPSPSQEDRNITRDLVYAARTVELKVLDHVIIGDNHSFSFYSQNLITQYEADYNKLK